MRALLITRLPRARAVGKRNAAAAVGRGQAARARRKVRAAECRLRFQVLRFVVHRLGDAELVFHAAAAARVLQHAPICTPALS